MNTEYLVYILEAYKCGSVNKAARNCYISQSHLSAIIRNIETEIGFELFHRTPNGITATPEGLAFMAHAEKIVVERKNIQNIPDSMAENDNLSIICSRSAFILETYFEYKRQYPSHGTSHDIFLEDGLQKNLKNIIAQTCRLGILVLFEEAIPKYMQLAEQYNLEMSVLQRSIPANVLMSRTHPLAGHKHIHKKQLLGHPFLADAHIDNNDTLDILGLQTNTDILYASDRATIFDAVRKGGYLAIGISIPEQDQQMMDCVCRPVVDCAPMAVALLHSRTFSLRARERHFIRYLTDRLDQQYPSKHDI